MYITFHAAIGVLIGEQISNPALSFSLGVMSHFLLDMIPHGDKQIDNWRLKQPSPIKITFIGAGIDFITMLLALYLISQTIQVNISIIAAIVGSILPDFMWGFGLVIEILLKRKVKLFESYDKLHDWFHKFNGRDIPYWFGLGCQILFVILIIVVT